MTSVLRLQHNCSWEASCETLKELCLNNCWLQAQLSDFKLELPQVAVIGSQSSGKSSVLEALVSTNLPQTHCLQS